MGCRPPAKTLQLAHEYSLCTRCMRCPAARGGLRRRAQPSSYDGGRNERDGVWDRRNRDLDDGDLDDGDLDDGDLDDGDLDVRGINDRGINVRGIDRLIGRDDGRWRDVRCGPWTGSDVR